VSLIQFGFKYAYDIIEKIKPEEVAWFFRRQCWLS
jgi:hypothetical protein